ncbi:hypothetical protein ACFE04_027799 [Oxalis oulophora]
MSSSSSSSSPSILSSIGTEIIGVMSPVSICMFLVVLLVYTLSPSNPFSSTAITQPTIRTAANLVYDENPSDTAATKLEGALLNALVFVILVAVVTFVLVALYYYNFTNFLKNYMRFSVFFVLATMGGSIFLSIIQHFSIPVDSVTCFLMLFNFTVVGVLSMFSGGVPIVLRQAYMVCVGIITATWFTKLPEWTTWALLVALAVYDLVAVLAPGGPLKLLVELASSRDDELPALVYEARPTQNSRNPRSGLGLLVAGVSDSQSIELQALTSENVDRPLENHANSEHTSVSEGEMSPLVSRSRERHSSSSSEYSTIVGNRENEIVMEEESSPLVDMLGLETDGGGADEMVVSKGIKLGLGDFVFYSVLVGRAAMFDLMTVYACYLGIISGLGCTLILLSVYRKALPALPISIALGVIFYFLTRLLMEPFVVGTATNLVMF